MYIFEHLICPLKARILYDRELRHWMISTEGQTFSFEREQQQEILWET